MALNITIIGTGYVGLVSAVGMADFGNYVVGVDKDPAIIKALNAGEPTIYEEGLPAYLRRNLSAGRLRFTTDASEALQTADLIFLTVGTPSGNDGYPDISDLNESVAELGRELERSTEQRPRIIAIKSTVPIGTCRDVARRIAAHHSARLADCVVVSNPEFLREGKALQDFFHPDRVIIGCEEPRARRTLEELYRPLNLIHIPIVWCGLETAELIKYAANSFLATKIAFINQIANLAEAVGADVYTAARALGLDGRISAKFLHPGPGFGGSCFPKDVRALIEIGRRHGTDMSIMRAAIEANEQQKQRVIAKLEQQLGRLQGLTVAILGVAFKADTDDVRESPAITVVEGLLRQGAIVRVYDPRAMNPFRALFGERISYWDTPFATMEGSDALMIMTEWNEFRNLDLSRVKQLLRGNVIVDARNVFDPKQALALGLRYSGIGHVEAAVP